MDDIDGTAAAAAAAAAAATAGAGDVTTTATCCQIMEVGDIFPVILSHADLFVRWKPAESMDADHQRSIIPRVDVHRYEFPPSSPLPPSPFVYDYYY